MSASQSQLSDPRYGYDFVVATTQSSINASMKEFLSGLTEPVVTMCYVADAQGQPQAIAYADLLTQAQGSDPFSVPSGTDPATSQDIKNLLGARFMMGFQAQIGDPPGVPPAEVPDIVTLGANTASVGFNLLCSEFVVVELVPGGGYSSAPTWMNVSQPPGSPWVFSSKVDLLMSQVSQSEFSGLPGAVQTQIQGLGGDTFSVQQLLFDLDNAALETTPVISGVQPGTPLYTVLNESFLGSYFTQMKAQGQPLLGCVITQPDAPPATLVPTSLALEVCPLLNADGSPIASPTPDQAGLATLNYLCSAGGDPLPPAVAFSWNWIDPSEESEADGVMAINRGSFARYLEAQLYPYASSNCNLPWVHVHMDGLECKFEWSLTGGQAPTVTYPQTGPTILSLSYASATAEDGAGLDDDMGKMKLSSTFELDVSVSGSTMTVTQHLVVYTWIRSLQTSKGGNVVDVANTDVYTLSVNQSGGLESTVAPPVRVDNSQLPTTDWFTNLFTELNSLISDVKQWASGIRATSLEDIPISVLQNFVFPGGKTFTFDSVAFSVGGDLTSEITYTATD